MRTKRCAHDDLDDKNGEEDEVDRPESAHPRDCEQLQGEGKGQREGEAKGG